MKTANSTVRQIFIVPYNHADWAWTHTRLWHERRYDLIINEVLDALKKYPEFRWYLDTYICALEPFLRRSPKRVAELRRRVQQGKIGVCGGFTNLRPNLAGEEALIRNLQLGRRRFQELFPGVDLSVHADVVDVALGHPQLPQLLTLAGYRYFRCWRPHYIMSRKKVPLEFVWKGLDGSRILASRGCYSGFFYYENLTANLKAELAYSAELSPTGIRWVSQGMDDCRPLRTPYCPPYNDDIPIALPQFLRDWRKQEKIPVRFGTPAEFFRELEKHPVPEVSGTIDPCDVGYNAGFAGSNGLWKDRVQLDALLRDAELWDALAGVAANGDAALGPEQFDPLWEKQLTISSHAAQWLFQADFDQFKGWAADVRRAATRIRESALQTLCAALAPDPHIVAVAFNSVPQARTEILPVTLAGAVKLPAGFQITDGTGRPLPFEVVRRLNDFEAEVRVQAELPAGGFSALRLVPLPPAGKGFRLGEPAQAVKPADPVQVTERLGQVIIANRVLEVEFRGPDLIRLKHRPAQIEVAEPAGGGFAHPRVLEMDPAGILHVGAVRRIREPEWSSAQVVTKTPLRAVFRREGRIGPHAVQQEFVLDAAAEQVTVHTTVDWQPQDAQLVLTHPLPEPDGKLFADIPFGVEEKKLADEPYGRPEREVRVYSDDIERVRPGMFFAKSFVDTAIGRNGLAVISRDGDRYYHLDTVGGRLSQILVNGIVSSPGWEVDVNEERKAVGRHRFTHDLYLHPGDWRRALVPAVAARLRTEPLVVYPDRAADPQKLPAQHSLLRLEPQNLILTAATRTGDGELVVRFFETAGTAATATLNLPHTVRSAVATDLLDQPLPLRVRQRGERLELKVHPWQIVTLRIAL